MTAPKLERVARLFEGTQWRAAGLSRRCYGVLAGILTFLCRAFSGNPRIAAPNFPPAGSRLHRVDGGKEFTELLSLNDLTARACLSPNRFIRVFRRHYGTTPNRYLNELRIDEAKRLLSGTSSPAKTSLGILPSLERVHLEK